MLLYALMFRFVARAQPQGVLMYAMFDRNPGSLSGVAMWFTWQVRWDSSYRSDHLNSKEVTIFLHNIM